jgi:hypothetical protein
MHIKIDPKMNKKKQKHLNQIQRRMLNAERRIARVPMRSFPFLEMKKEKGERR